MIIHPANRSCRQFWSKLSQRLLAAIHLAVGRAFAVGLHAFTALHVTAAIHLGLRVGVVGLVGGLAAEDRNRCKHDDHKICSTLHVSP